MLFQNLMTHCQPKPATAGTSTEPSLEYPLQIAFRYAGPRISNLNLGSLRTQISTPKTEPSSTGHKAKRIQGEIKKHLFETMPVGAHGDAAQAIGEMQFNFCLLGQRTQEVVRLVEQLPEIHFRGFRLRSVVEMQHVVHGRGKRA